MKYFVIFTLLAFLCVVFYIDVLKHVIAPNPEYWAGLRVVPIVMAAEILMGVYFNLSFWYKLIDKTLWGALFSFVGCAVLIAMNVLLVPKFGYMACAWAGVAGYGVAMVMSYIVGQKKNPIDYDLKSILSYVAVAAVLYFVAEYLKVGNTMLQLVVNTAMLCVFAMMIVKKSISTSVRCCGGDANESGDSQHCRCPWRRSYCQLEASARPCRGGC